MKKAIITAADNMSDETYGILCRGVADRFGADITFERVCDNSIIGGFVLNVDGEVFDLSVATQLGRLEKHIKE